MGAARLDTSLILDLAEREFALHGFEGMSMRVLAERCSATAAALYHHFSSKEALYDEVCTRIFDTFVVDIDQALKGAATPEQRLERFVSTLFDKWDGSTLLLLTQRDVINANISPERSFSSPHYRLLFGLIRKIQSQYFQDEIDDTLAFAFGSMFYGYCSLLVLSQNDSGLAHDNYRRKRKTELLSICNEFMRMRRAGARGIGKA